MQEAVLSAGCIPALIKLASSANDELRLNAVWALQNLVYQASSDVRKALLDALSWRHAVELLSDIRSEVQVSGIPASIFNPNMCMEFSTSEDPQASHNRFGAVCTSPCDHTSLM